MEVWKDVEGYEGLYQVSNMGRVKSTHYYHGTYERILKSGKDQYGYSLVNLFKYKKGKMHKVHRLVAQAFLDNPDNLSEVNHKDENPSNNCVDNLEWCTHKYNINYGTCIQRMVKKKRGAYNTKKSKIVYQYTMNGEFVANYPSVSEIERQFGYGQGNISRCCLGKRKTAYGYIWRYAD